MVDLVLLAWFLLCRGGDWDELGAALLALGQVFIFGRGLAVHRSRLDHQVFVNPTALMSAHEETA